jgi:hypothetical protein
MSVGFTGSMKAKQRFSSSTMSMISCLFWRGWQRSGDLDIVRSATHLSSPSLQQNQLEDCESRNVPIVDCVDTDRPALFEIWK